MKRVEQSKAKHSFRERLQIARCIHNVKKKQFGEGLKWGLLKEQEKEKEEIYKD